MLHFSLEPFLRRFFHRYGQFVHKFRWPMLLAPPLISLCLSVGFLWFSELEMDDPAYVFTPRDARWKKELGTFSKLWPLEENKFIPGKSFEMKRFVNVLCKAKDGGNILRPQILDEISLLNKFIAENVTVPTVDRRFNLSYQDLCLSYDWVCGNNEHIEMFRQMTQVGRLIDLRYPKGGNKDTPAYLGTALGDIALNGTDGTVMEAKVTQLFYFLKQDPPVVRQYSTDFEYAVERFLLHAFESPLISISFAHYQSLQDGLDENARRFVPNFVISFTFLALFCICCSFTFLPTTDGTSPRHAFAIDWIRSKPYVACAGLFNTILSLISSFGFLLLLGIPYNVINTIIPFLIIAVGIDDMFVMNSCWDQSDPALSPDQRMAQMMQNGGVAVSITNITDILAFLIGCVTELPGIELFCLYAFAAVLFCYVYQLTFFAAFMAIMGNVEQQGKHCLLLRQQRPPRGKEAQISSDSLTSINPPSGTSSSPSSTSLSTAADVPSQCSARHCQHPATPTTAQITDQEEVAAEASSTRTDHLQLHIDQSSMNASFDSDLTGRDEHDQSTDQRWVLDQTVGSDRNRISDQYLRTAGQNRSAARKWEIDQDQIADQNWNSDQSQMPVQQIWKRDRNRSPYRNDQSRSTAQNRATVPKLRSDRIWATADQCESAADHKCGADQRWVKIDQNGLDKNRLSSSDHTFVSPSPPSTDHHHHLHASNFSHRFFGHYFGPLLLHPIVRALITVVYVAYIGIAIVGCMNFREGLEPSHLVTSDHYIARYFDDMKTFWKMGPQLHIAVLNPPNFTDPNERQKLIKMVESFENTPYTMGREGTVFFFLEFLNYLDQLNAEPENTDRIWHKKLRSWLKNTGGSNQWDSDIVYTETGTFRAYRLQVAMKNIVEPDQHKLAAKLLREIADRQPFRLEIYHEAFPFADQYLIILPSTYRNVFISLLCMTIIAILLIPSIPSAILIILSIVSISTGVFGYMTFWGVNLDAVSMISIIMSIGFAVDLSAHIVYAFVSAHGDKSRERVINALEHIGWPIFQVIGNPRIFFFCAKKN
ncbi:hypothetical protein niasHT_031068 [Heterodera trifolii]|uniref:SSD domain-containing protein n=1 Tax=Heterodera trifolii TaxID=157864 RepID=A0ABD2HYW6_9BILA